MLIEEAGISTLSAASAAVAEFERCTKAESVRCRQISHNCECDASNAKIEKNNLRDDQCKMCELKQNKTETKTKIRRRSLLFNGLRWIRETFSQDEFIMNGNDEKGKGE